MELGDEADAESNFIRSYANAHRPFDVWTETPSGGAINFITGVGGFLQTVLFGLSGLRILPDHLALAPTLLEGMTEVKLRGIHYRGSKFQLVFNETTMIVHCTFGNITIAPLRTGNKTMES